MLLHAIRRGASVDLSSLATRDDLQAVSAYMRVLRTELEKNAIKSDVAGVRGDLAEAKGDILKRVIGATGFQTFVVLAALAALSRLH